MGRDFLIARLRLLQAAAFTNHNPVTQTTYDKVDKWKLQLFSEASGELVGLLQERQTLQEEVDIRSVTIEQLLKFAERRQLQLGEPLAIQMSVVRNHCHEASSESGLG